MIRTAAAIGLLYGCIEVLAIHGLSAWRGASIGALLLIAAYAALGAIGGGAISLIRRFRGARSAVSPTALLAGSVAVAALFALTALGAHSTMGWIGLLPTSLIALSAVAIATAPKDEKHRAPSSLPTVASVAVVLAAIGFGSWAGIESRNDSPAGPRQIIGLSSTPNFAFATPVDRRPPKLMMIGIDGASWNVILPMIDRGKLPTLKRLLDDGVAGVIASSYQAFSPIEWTTASTGKIPENHGLFDLTHTRSTHRRVRTLYSMLGDMEFESLVANVPGTYPAEPIPGAMFAGFPVQKESMNTLGHLYTSRPGDAFTLPTQTLQMDPESLELSGIAGSRRGHFEQRETSAKEQPTALGWAKGRLGKRGGIYAGWADRSYGRVRFVETEGGLRFDLAEGGESSFTLQEGEWSPWVRIERKPTALAFRIRVVEQNAEAITLYATPLFPLSATDRIQPPELAEEVDRRFGPYVVEGAGWMLFQAPELLPVLQEHQFQIAEQKRNTVTTLWNEKPWDALFYIVTLTDRIQHSFWSFMDHESYPAIPNAAPYPYDARPGFQPEDYQSVVADSYEFADEVLGDFLEKAGPETVVLIVSDHGGTSGPHKAAAGAGIHHPDGIYLFSGGIFHREHAPELDRDEVGYPDPRIVGEPLRLQDLVPTLLAALDFPIAKDFDGGPSLYVLDYLTRQNRSPELVATYERESDRRDVDEGELDESALEQLRSLGYVQ